MSGGPCLQELFNNGPLVTHPGMGKGGADVSSAAFNVIGGQVLLGYTLNARRYADTFTVGSCGWQINKIRLYAMTYMRSLTLTPSFANVRLWNGPPGAGGAVMIGDDGTTYGLNQLNASAWTGIYRVKDATSTNLLNIDAPIMYADVVLAKPWVLAPGGYFLDFAVWGSGSWFQPPVSNATQWVVGSSRHFVSSAWSTQKYAVPFSVWGVAGTC